jgi:protein-glutamine gamma-glutamyltransferase
MTSIPLANLAVLFAGIVMTVAPHALRLPIWITALTVGLFGWRAWAAYNGERLPRKWLLFLLVIAGVFAVYMSNRSLFGRDAGVTMLVLFLGLKLMETRNERDVVVVTFLCYFIALTNFFYTQSIPTAVYLAANVLVLTAALVGFNAMRRPWQRNFRTAAVLLLQAVPVMLILFVLFPRVQGPLWGLPQDAYSSMTGLSDSMSPGAISNLSQSDEIAFRVRFEGGSSAPPRAQLYWRGPVFWRFDGRTWTPGRGPQSDRYEFVHRGELIRYEVTLEPHNRLWLFGLELPVQAAPFAAMTADYQMLARAPVRARMRYRLASYTDFSATGGGDDAELREATVLPVGSNPRTVALGRAWRNELRTDQAILERALAFFREQGFAYTLQPPLLGEHSADDFIFGTKRGFCEHFSSSFAILMRAAGVPARVVTGYQGGEINPVDGYLIVRQADAHAWTEIWIGGRGWVRVDPTAAAIPVRIDGGLAAAVPATDPVPLLMRGVHPLFAKLRYNWEAMSNYWNQWVLGYNPDRQRDLFQRLGFASPSMDKLLTLAFWGVFAALAIVVAVMLRRVKPKDPVQRAWLRFCRKLARVGLARNPAEGPLDYVARVGAERPAVAPTARGIGELYVDLRYGRATDRDARLVQLRQLVRAFRAQG